MVAYDLETDAIAAGTPDVKYITAYSEDGAGFDFASPIRDMRHLRDVLVSTFLTDEFEGMKFVAWNANAFDAYFISAALLDCPEFVLRPYLTKNNALRGLKVLRADQIDDKPNAAVGWEFVDGMAQLGMTGVSLEKFLKTFAPDHQKLVGAINWEGGEKFDATNALHREYARQDSKGLWHAMQRAQAIMLEHFNQPLTATIGNACIKIFKAHIPKGVQVRTLAESGLEVVRRYVMRGGYCFCVRRYSGPVWKYDLNQAYAAAMRDARLPHGEAFHCSNGVNRFAPVYMARVTATNPDNRVPFYHRADDHLGLVRSVFATTRLDGVWLTSLEVEQLQAEGWQITVHESWCWGEAFNMREFVDKLEVARMNAPGGPSGPEGTMIKSTGNNAYGKLASQSPRMKLVMARQRPPGYQPYMPDGDGPVENVYYQWDEDARAKDHEQPQLAAIITAHVRMVVRRAALLNPAAWLYADTDCVVFSESVTDQLQCDPKKYGAWKIEEQGTPYLVIAKKVYINMATGQGHSKGLNVKKLKPEDFVRWYDGHPPEQLQVMRQNYVKTMQGSDMYRNQTRKGTSV